MLKFIEKETNKNPDATVIWLHGLGANGYDFADIIPELDLPQHAKIKFIFPHANPMSVSINNGYVMPAWYDISNVDLGKEPDIKGIEENSKQIAELIDEEIKKGINSERIILIGFSQGGVMALHTATRYTKKLAGAASLSSYFPTANTMQLNSVNAKIPVFFGYGNFDNVVNPKLSQEAIDFFKANKNQIEYYSYNMQHSVCIEELKQLGLWLTKILL